MMKPTENCKICNKTNFEVCIYTRDYFLTGEHFNIYNCTNCGYKFTFPIPHPSIIGNYYKSTNYVSHSDTKKGLFFKLYHVVKSFNIKNKYNLVASYKKIGKILDYGCGTGDFLKLFKDNNWLVSGIEPDTDTRNYATEKHKIDIKKPENITDYEDNFFDVISLWHVLEHIPDLNEKIVSLKKILKKDGILVIAVPNCNSFDAQHYGKYWAAYDVPRHIHHFDKHTLSLLFEKHNFEIVKIKNMLFDSFYVSLLSEKYLKTKMGFLKGLFWGFISNLKTLQKNTYASSIIFVLKQK